MASHGLNGSAVNLAKAFQNVIVEAIASIRADNRLKTNDENTQDQFADQRAGYGKEDC